MDQELSKYKRIVIKIGSSILTQSGCGLNYGWLRCLAQDIAQLRDTNVMIVSSGAIASGRHKLDECGFKFPSSSLSLKENQAAAAVGQISLSRAYDETFGAAGLTTAQILLTIGDTESRRQYLNARATIGTLLKWGILPVINENDTVATTEIRYGDNDRLAARVASMMEADLLILLSDVDGLYTAPPNQNSSAELISEIPSITPEIMAMAGQANSDISRGGMITKLEAGKIATAAGITMVIAQGHGDHALASLIRNGTGSWFLPDPVVRNAKKNWIAGGLRVTGKILIDSGAYLALESGKSLLPAGVTDVQGDFSRGDTVLIVGPHGHELGRGLVEYDYSDACQIIGKKSSQIVEILGPSIRTELIHRDNLVLDTSNR